MYSTQEERLEEVLARLKHGRRRPIRRRKRTDSAHQPLHSAHTKREQRKNDSQQDQLYPRLVRSTERYPQINPLFQNYSGEEPLGHLTPEHLEPINMIQVVYFDEQNEDGPIEVTPDLKLSEITSGSSLGDQTDLGIVQFKIQLNMDGLNLEAINQQK